MGRDYDWVIMNGSAWIKGRPSIDKIINQNEDDGTIIVVKRYDNQYTEKFVRCFIVGAQGNYGQVGDKKVHVKDTGISYGGIGKCIIENIITINNNSVVSSVNDIGLNEKRPLYVFK